MRRTLSRLYGAAAWRRRRWYACRPEARRRLHRPVISVGGLRVGGSGKTPLTAHLARLLLAMGERPAVLSRGYGRDDAVDGVVVVREAGRIVGRLTTAGDEPWMLARSLDGVSVVVDICATAVNQVTIVVDQVAIFIKISSVFVGLVKQGGDINARPRVITASAECQLVGRLQVTIDQE